MPKILEGYNDAKLVIAGKGGMIDELKGQVEALGLGKKVCFAGYMNGKDVGRLYKASDISVFPKNTAWVIRRIRKYDCHWRSCTSYNQLEFCLCRILHYLQFRVPGIGKWRL